MMILIKNTTAFLGKNFERHDNIDILIEDDRIKRIGKIREQAKILDGTNFFVTPGFVNAHFHPSQQLNRALGIGISHDKQMDLLHASDKIKTAADRYWLSYIAVLEGLKSGTTCFNSVGSEIETQIRVYKNMGVRAACILFPKDIIAKEKEKQIRAYAWKTAERIRKAEELHRKYHSDLVRIHFGAVNVRYCSDKLIKGMLRLAEKYGVGFHMHAAEGNIYVNKVRERTGYTPVEYLYKIHALNHRVSLAHMTKLTEKEIEYLAKTNTHVVHCPRANSYVAVGLCPVKELLDKGVNVALGSDAAINNNSNEVRGEAHAAFDKIADKYEKADIIDYLTLFKMLTINGAKAMVLENEIGTIEVGKKADLVLWRKNDLPFIPGFNYLADMIFTDSCRAHTIFINGKIVLKNYKTTLIDEEEIKKKAMLICKKYYGLFKKYVAKYI